MGQGLVGKVDRFFLADNQLTNCDAYPVAAPQHSCCFEYGMQIDLFVRKSHYDSYTAAYIYTFSWRAIFS